MTNRLSHFYQLAKSTFIFRHIRVEYSFLFHFSTSHLGLLCLPMSNKKDARLILFDLLRGFCFFFRWMRLRHAMLPAFMFLEPIFHSMVLGLMNSWAFNHLFGFSPLFFFLIHLLVWFLLDYSMISIFEVIVIINICICNILSLLWR